MTPSGDRDFESTGDAGQAASVTRLGECQASVVWKVSTNVAWVDAEPDAIALIDLSLGPSARPYLVLEPAAHLWRIIGTEGANAEQLLSAADIAGVETPERLVEAFLEQLLELGILTREKR